MDKWTICVFLSSLAGSVLCGIWVILSRVLRNEKYTCALQCSINVVVFLFSLFALGGVGLCIYIDLAPGKIALPMHTNSIKALLVLLSYVWIGGVFWRLYLFLRQMLQIWNMEKTYIPGDLKTKKILDEVCKEMGIKRNIQLCQSGVIPTARIERCFRPRICIPAKEYHEDRLRAIFAHELVHYLNRDRWIRQCAMLLGCVHWFNPLVNFMYRSLERWNEFYCDYRVCNHFGVKKQTYVATLMEMAEYALQWREQYKKAMIMNLSLIGKNNVLSERIERIMNFSGKNRQSKMMAFVLCMVFVLLGSSTALAAGSGVESLYKEAIINTYENQHVEEIENVEDEILQEYEIAAEDIAYAMDATMESVSPAAQPSASFTTTVTDEWWQSGRFQASAGQNIYVSVSATPNDIDLKVGIIEPDSTWRFVVADGNINHNFALDQTGTYIVFVWNETTTPVTVYGFYNTTDPS